MSKLISSLREASRIFTLRRDLEAANKKIDNLEKKVEQLQDALNILATFEDKIAHEVVNIAAHIALQEATGKKQQLRPAKRRSTPDDDMIN
jgi:hypothetical protein